VNGRDVKEDIEMAIDYYKFAAVQSHCRAKLNHKRFLRFLSEWKPPDHLTAVISHPSFSVTLSKMQSRWRRITAGFSIPCNN
jgi:hypothetical protein